MSSGNQRWRLAKGYRMDLFETSGDYGIALLQQKVVWLRLACLLPNQTGTASEPRQKIQKFLIRNKIPHLVNFDGQVDALV